MSIRDLDTIFARFEPTHVLHLAAKANLNSHSIDDFPENTIGTENVIKCLNDSRHIARFIYFSTQYVVRPGVLPVSDDFLLPYTPYGESKAKAETIIRSTCQKNWTILRPTNVWGPFHPSFPYEMWKYLKLRLYLHPGYQPVKKYYSYVTNAVDQILAITLADYDIVNARIFYITDPPINNAEWMNAFSVALAGSQIRHIPIELWRLLAVIGDTFSRFGIKFPMSSDRLYRLTINEQIPYESTIELAGLPKTTMEEGVLESVEWYKQFLSVKLAN